MGVSPSDVAQMAGELKAALDLLEKHQWVESDDGITWCVECEALPHSGHDPDCALAALLRRNGREVK